MKLNPEQVANSIQMTEKCRAYLQQRNRPVDQNFDVNEAIEALYRLVNFAQTAGGSGSFVIKRFLVGLYNGDYKFDLTDFRLLDHCNFDDCVKVLRLDHPPFFCCEVHKYFEDGSQIFKTFIEDIAHTNA